MESLFERVHSCRRKESPDDSLRKISSWVSIKASSLLYSWNKNTFQYINKAFSFCVCYVGTFRNPQRRVEAEKYARALDVASRQLLAPSSIKKFTESALQGTCNACVVISSTILCISSPSVITAWLAGPRKFSANNDVSWNQ